MKATIIAINPYVSKENGEDDGARTRDLCRDSEPSNGNLQESGGTDGHSKYPEEPMETLIAPVANPRPLPYRPLPNLNFAGKFALTSAAARQRS